MGSGQEEEQYAGRVVKLYGRRTNLYKMVAIRAIEPRDLVGLPSFVDPIPTRHRLRMRAWALFLLFLMLESQHL